MDIIGLFEKAVKTITAIISNLSFANWLGLPNFNCKKTKNEILGPLPSNDDANMFFFVWWW